MPVSAKASFYHELQKANGTTVSVTDIKAMRVQNRYDWDSNGNILYEAIAGYGVSSSATDWLIFKYTYNDSDYSSSPDSVKTAIGAWDNRTSLTYE